LEFFLLLGEFRLLLLTFSSVGSEGECGEEAQG
jgi:hypothetical protein